MGTEHYADMSMLAILQEVIRNDLPELIQDREKWQSLDVTYEPPHVERVWCQHGDLRVYLHRIHPVDLEDEPLFHPHPWPSAVRIITGKYEHKVGLTAHAEGNKDLPVSMVLSRSILGPGSEYEMANRDAWHSVKPLGHPSDSIMVVGPLYDPPVEMPSPPIEKQEPLSEERFNELFNEWKTRFERRR